MVGDKLRQARVARQLSLADVAGEARVSAATLSRVERDKQAIDVELFLTLARVLSTAPAELLHDGDGDSGGDAALAARITSMETRRRTELWRELGADRREQRQRKRAGTLALVNEVEELLAQLDFLREAIESVQARLVQKR